MGNLSRVAVAALCFFALLVVGCAPQWRVIRQAEPNPFLSTKETFGLAPVDYSRLQVGELTEAAYLATKDDGQRESFEVDKTDSETRFAEAFEAGAKGAGLRVVDVEEAAFVAHVHLDFFEPGYYAFVASAPAKARYLVRIERADGTTLDTLELEAEVEGLSSGERMRTLAGILGDALARYLVTRVHPETKS